MDELKVYEIRRTRLVTEWFRVEAESEEDATQRLDNADAPVEQVELSTWYSNIDSVEVK